ncbi:MAG: helix-hairpin-helix domain-containing protein [Kiritimatiellae bacterium]|nr:helix-hairpin-helix domain-containing protein [Kiritimatiellia bacterium]
MRRAAGLFGVMYCLAVMGPACVSCRAADMESYHGVQWIPNEANDGDSFSVQLDKQRKVRVRLYFVDCPETSASWESDVRRIREQRRYFGLSDEQTLIEIGKEAAEFTRERLQKPFTVYTAFASALGRSAEGRIYAFVQTSDGDDLATLLVRQGLARAYGVGRENQNGVRRDEIKAKLSDLEGSAMLRNVGAWKYSDPDLLADLRATQRQEDTEIRSIRSGIGGGDADEPPELIVINTASKRELQTLPGIGPAIAERILKNRPFQELDEMQRVQGITLERIEILRPFIRLD